MKRDETDLKQNINQWVDHLEGELEPSLHSDLELVLKNSKEQQRQYQNLKKVRQAVRANKEYNVPLPEDAKYYDALHERIMKGISGTQVQSKPRVKLIQIVQSRTIVMTIAVLFLTVFIGRDVLKMKNSEKHPLSAEARLQLAFEGAVGDADVLGDSFLSHEDEIDLYIDLATKKMGSMGKNEKDNLFRELKR